jgi:hypothetical protein
LLQAQANEARRAKLAAGKAQADEKVAAVTACLPELEAEKRAAATKKVRGDKFVINNAVHTRKLLHKPVGWDRSVTAMPAKKVQGDA